MLKRPAQQEGKGLEMLTEASFSHAWSTVASRLGLSRGWSPMGWRVQEHSHELRGAASGELTLMWSRVSVSNSTSSLSVLMSCG